MGNQRKLHIYLNRNKHRHRENLIVNFKLKLMFLIPWSSQQLITYQGFGKALDKNTFRVYLNPMKYQTL